MNLPAFTPKKGQPPLHLREWTEEERAAYAKLFDDYRRMQLRMKFPNQPEELPDAEKLHGVDG